MRRGDGKGFTLLEVLVALSVLAMCYGALLQVIGGATRQAARAAEYREALLVAESRLDVAAWQGSATPASGTSRGKYAWQVRVEPAVGAGAAGTPALYAPELVTVTVSWGEREAQRRALEISTIRLGGRPGR